MKKGFTLIELLVVIAIIAILAAILFPVFAQAREKARASACLSNTKQFGTALQLYTDDYDETVPPCYFMALNWNDNTVNHTTYAGYPCSRFNVTDWCLTGGAGKYWTWMDSIFPYVKNLNMYYCPSVGPAKETNSAGYGYNWLITTRTWNADYINASKGLATPYALSQIKNPSEIVFVGDCTGWKGQNASALILWGGQAMGIKNDVNASKLNQVVRHNEGSNFTFVDGHAKYYKYGQGPNYNNYNGAGDNKQYWDPMADCYK